MRTVGVDLSAAPERTAAATIEWGRRRATVPVPEVGLDDEELLQRLADAEWVGIDAPFGWPQAMVGAVHEYATEGTWPPSSPKTTSAIGAPTASSARRFSRRRRESSRR
jgi:hypothetical protein